MSSAGAPQLSQYFYHIPATSAVFAAFLGFNPVSSILTSLPASVTSSIPVATTTCLTGNTFFPNAIAPAFMSALGVTFYIGLGISVLALVISYFRGGASLDEAIRARPGDRVASEPHPQAPIPTSRNVEALEVSQWGETASPGMPDEGSKGH